MALTLSLRSAAPPASVAELMERANQLAGLTLGQLAERWGGAVPDDLRRAKGWVGSLLERCLGATAGCRAEPDFPQLGVELKTLPVDERGKPLETTFVCTIELRSIGAMEWGESRVRHKLARVLWVPVLGVRSVPVAERVVGTPLLWTLQGEDEAALQADWEELAGRIGQGAVGDITGHWGRYLQVRPKGANAASRRRAYDSDGQSYDELPRGFYLRTQFTARLLARHFALPSR